MSRLENDLEFLEEPNAEDLRAVEELGDRPAQRRALVVLVADHALSSGEDTDRLVTELLQEDGFAVDAVVRVQSKRSLICPSSRPQMRAAQAQRWTLRPKCDRWCRQ